MVKNLPPNAGDARDVGSIPGLGRAPGWGEHSNPLQYCLESPTDRGAWQSPVHGAAKSRTWLNIVRAYAYTHTYTPTAGKMFQCSMNRSSKLVERQEAH